MSNADRALRHDLRRLEGLLASSAASSPGNLATIIWRPGVPSTAAAVATWGEVATRIARAAGLITVAVDSSIAPAHVPGSSGVTDCTGVTFSSFTQQIGPAPLFAGDTFTIDDGATLHRPRAFIGFLGVLCDSKTAASMTFNEGATTFDIVEVSGAAIATTLTATIPAIEVTGSLQFDFSNAALGQAGAQPVFHVGAGSNLRLFFTGPTTFIDQGAVTGAPAPGVVNFFHDAATPFFVFPGVAVNGTQDQPIDQPSQLGPQASTGTTAYTTIPTPTVVVGAGAGAGSAAVTQTTVGGAATDMAGVLSILAGAGAGPGLGATVSFSSPWRTGEPRAVVLTPLDAGAAGLQVFCTKSVNGWTVNAIAATPFVNGTSYQWSFIVLG